MMKTKILSALADEERLLAVDIDTNNQSGVQEQIIEDNENAVSLIVFVNIAGAVACVAFVALISCMLLGFLTLDVLDLRIKARASIDKDERQYASSLLPIVKQHHRLLVTLLLLNALAYEALPLFLDHLVPTWVAIVLSVTFLLVFGEIIPSAIFTGPEQLRLASKLVPLLNFFMWLLAPISLPLVKLLDCLVPGNGDEDGNEDSYYHRGELSALVRIQYEQREAKRARAITTTGSAIRKVQTSAATWGGIHDGKREWKALKNEIMEAVGQIQVRSRSNSLSSDATPLPTPAGMEPLPLHHAEVRMVEGALNMKTKVAMDVYTPIRTMFAIPSDMVLNKQHITKIYSEGYSRIPVYDPHPKCKNRKTAVRGVLMARQLILIDWDDERLVSTMPLQIPPCVSPRKNLVDLLQLLQRGGSLIAFVCAQPNLASRSLENGDAIPVEAGFMGLVTLEDVLESVLQDRIYDEEDMHDRNLASARLTQWAAKTLQRFVRHKRERSISTNAALSSSQDSKTEPGGGTNDPHATVLHGDSNSETTVYDVESNNLLPTSTTLTPLLSATLSENNVHSNMTPNYTFLNGP